MSSDFYFTDQHSIRNLREPENNGKVSKTALIDSQGSISKLLVGIWKVLEDTLPLHAAIKNKQTNKQSNAGNPWSSEYL